MATAALIADLTLHYQQAADYAESYSMEDACSHTNQTPGSRVAASGDRRPFIFGARRPHCNIGFVGHYRAKKATRVGELSCVVLTVVDRIQTTAQITAFSRAVCALLPITFALQCNRSI